MVSRFELHNLEIAVNDQKRILIVDDEFLNRRFFQAVVEDMGHQCLCVEDGVAALARLSPEIDLILMDVSMPGLSGFEVARRIRSGDSCRETPIIMVTALDCAESRATACAVGANGFLAKPVDHRELRLRIQELLPKGGPTDSAA